jgi:Mrp family chromosome partitioning ATPase/capsular polysaccharide biosynthesis protein
VTQTDIIDDSRARDREGALSPYLRAIQAHRLVFVLIVVATVAAAAIWTSTSKKEYSATAQILVTPVSQNNQSLLGLDLLRESGDPTRTVQTAAALVETRSAAEKAAKTLGGGRTPQQLLGSVSVQPEGESDVLDVTATAPSPASAATISNAFASAALAIRRETLQAQVAGEIARIESETPATPEQERRINALQTLEKRGDPTMSLAQKATPSSSPVGASAALVIGLALLAGLALGTGTAVVLQLLERKIRDEDEAMRLFPLPILARVPVLSRSARRALEEGDWTLQPHVREPFRTLIAQLQRVPDHQVVMFTSGSTGDGKTTSSINLATTMALGGHQTILIDTDFRKPGVSEALRIAQRDLPPDLSDGSLEKTLEAVPGVDNLRVLAPRVLEPQDEAQIEAFVEQLPEILEQATNISDYVVIDTPPLGEISDALRITPHTDDIVVVVYPGNTNRANYEIMRDLLERSGDKPKGLLVIGDSTGASSTYYAYGMERQRKLGPKLKN